MESWCRQVVFQSRPVECLENAIVDIFGSELFAGLQELDFAKGNLRLTGFLSKLSHGLSSKVRDRFSQFLKHGGECFLFSPL